MELEEHALEEHAVTEHPPRVESDPTGSGSREPRAVRRYSLALLGAGIAAGAALLSAGAPPPPPGPVLLFAIALALCINRFAFFPSELAATAEAAVLLAAVVGFRHQAVFLGPLALALLVGPLDALHWEQRSFVRMSYNAGSRALSTLAAAFVFAGTYDAAGSSPVAVAVAVLAAAAAFTTVDSAGAVALVVLQGEPGRVAVRYVRDIDALTLPIALYGAAAGFLATELGWWAATLALVPAAFVPELVLARARSRRALVRNVVLAAEIVAGLALLAIVLPVPDPATLAVLVAIGVLAGAELAVDTRTTVAPLLAVAVIAATVVADGERAYFAAILVAITGTLTAWWSTGPRPPRRVLAALLLAAGTAGLAAAVFALVASDGPGSVLVAMSTGAVFESVAVALGGPMRRRFVEMLWTAPLLAVAAASAFAWRATGLAGAAFFGLTTAGTFAAAAWWGAPPWRSRVLGGWARRVPARGHRGVLLGTGAGAFVLAVAATVVVDGGARPVLVWMATAMSEAAAAMSLVAVRQWRFEPRRRAREALALLAAVAVTAGVYPVAASDGSSWSVVLLTATLGAVLVVGSRHARWCDSSAAIRAIATRGR